MMTDHERRATVLPIDVRADGDGTRLEGYAAVFDTPAEIGGRFGWSEVIERGAFSASLERRDDVRATFNHDPSVVLGRTPKTLTLVQDERGLRASIVTPDTTAARDVLELVKRGDVSGMSIAFRVPQDGEQWSEPSTRGGRPLRTIRAVELVDVSVVTYPAYASTSVSARTMAEAWREGRGTGEWASRHRQWAERERLRWRRAQCQ